MKKTIVITSIYEPTEAVKRFSKRLDYNLLVVGDKKTPLDWSCPSVTFISVTAQQQAQNPFAKKVPFNHYS